MNGSNLDKTIKPNEFTNVTLVPKDNKVFSTHNTILSTCSTTTQNEEAYEPCDKCEKPLPNQKKAKDLHMQAVHNIKTFKATPGPVRRSTTITRRKAGVEIQTRTSIKCGLCNFACKTGPSMKRHTEMFHNNDTVGNLPKEKKRQRSSYTCLSCNSTFTSNYMRNKHVKEQHEGKNILSPERKIARKDVDNKQTTEQIKEDIVTIPRKELEDLQDLLVQTGKEKEALNERIEAINIRMYDIEKENCNLKQETKYLKSENEKANENINKLDNLYQIRVTELKKSAEQNDIEMKIVKDQLEKHLKVKPQAEVEQKEVAREGHQENTKGNHEATYTIQCRECDFSGSTQNELDEHHRNDCSEALIQRLVEEENGFACQRCGMEFSGRTRQEWEQHQQNNCSGLVCPICGVIRNSQHNMEIHMEYHDNDDQDTDWSNEEETQAEEGDVAGEEATGESEEAWHRVGSRYKCPTCGITRNTKNGIERHMREHEEDIHECIHSITTCEKCSNMNKIEAQKTIIHEITAETFLKCNQCEESFRTKSELIDHIKKHKSYKPCDDFQEARCVDDKCRFAHKILQQGEHICYKCGDIFRSKRDMLKHIEHKHGNTMCYKFLRNECRARRCLYSHGLPASDVATTTERNISQTTAPDFHRQHTTRPVVWSQVVAQGTQAQVQSNMSEEVQNQSQGMEAQVLQALTKMIPQLTKQLICILRTGNSPN